MSELVRVRAEDDDQIWRVSFGAGTGNILDRATITELRRVLADAARAASLKAICLEGQGENFSYGASIQEHLPADATAMLEAMRGLIFDLLASQVVVVAAVKGRCLGGGLELVAVCHRIVAARSATFGQPEIKVGVFAPYASILLPERIGRAAAEDLCLTGRSIAAGEAHAIGLADEVVDADPCDRALGWIREHLVPHSASTLRLAVKAGRMALIARLSQELPRVERLYLDELMATHDAAEGLQAFLEKRPPRWRSP
jgi:cyclohexa-1,5-dienecarbonyl-CoA hydratase